MDTLKNMTVADWTAVLQTLLTAGLLAVAVAAALFAKHQWKAAAQQAEVARHAEQETRRPYVLVTAEPSPTDGRDFDLVVRNIGLRPAVNARIRLDPPPRRTREVDGFEIANIRMLNDPIAMIAPGHEMRTAWDRHADRHDLPELPWSHNVHATYEDTSGTTFDEHSVIDLAALCGTVTVSYETLNAGR